jgi:hypothetical protein
MQIWEIFFKNQSFETNVWRNFLRHNAIHFIKKYITYDGFYSIFFHVEKHKKMAVYVQKHPDRKEKSIFHCWVLFNHLSKFL